MEEKKMIEIVAGFSGDDFARVVPRDPDTFPYKDCVIQRGTFDEDDNPVDDGRFHVVCSDWSIPPNTVRDEPFATPEEALRGFEIEGRPLAEWTAELRLNEILDA